MTQLLASVVNHEEAMLALEAGVDIIDLKNPAEGALGALPLSVINEIFNAVGRRKPISATIGDLPMRPGLVADQVEKIAATGVDFIKIGFFAGDHDACLQALQPLAAKGLKLIAVLFADQSVDFSILPKLYACGFYGVMLDTCTKDGSSLLHHMKLDELQAFVNNARESELFCGLAGSVQIMHVPDLIKLRPDYIGFRSALCFGSKRTSSLDRQRIRALCDVLYKCNTSAAKHYKAQAV